MNRIRTATFHLLIAFMVLCFASAAFAQTPSPTPTPEAPPSNRFAPQPAGPLPAAFTRADASEPLATVKPGVYDAGEAASGLKHLMLLKKPHAFDLGTNDPTAPK